MDDQSLRAQMDTTQNQQGQAQPICVSSSMKEQSPQASQGSVETYSTPAEYTPPKETANIIKVKNENIEVPPDLQAKGVSVPASTQPVSDVTTTSNGLPLTDDQIGEGQRASYSSGFKWLSEWCILQLKKMHMHLKKVHGHFVRVTD
jgi:hypothetical protein